jgi:hypothetical protein
MRKNTEQGLRAYDIHAAAMSFDEKHCLQPTNLNLLKPSGNFTYDQV